MATSKIGDHEFIALYGEWQPPRMMLETDQRPGIDGTQLTRVGVKGQPFTLRSFVDAENYTAAHEKYIEYLRDVGTEPLVVEKDGERSEDHGFKCVVMNVTADNIKAVETAVGGLNADDDGDSKAILECTWELIACAVEQP